MTYLLRVCAVDDEKKGASRPATMGHDDAQCVSSPSLGTLKYICDVLIYHLLLFRWHCHPRHPLSLLILE